MATIVGGMSAGRRGRTQPSFPSFWRADIGGRGRLFAAKVVTDPALVSTLRQNLATLLLGNVVAFLVALAAIRFFIGFLTRHGFRIFGYYRIAIG
jgi:undecaprenyl-diphosphatase